MDYNVYDLIDHCGLDCFNYGDHIVLKAENDTGKGAMTFYEIINGIQLIYNDFHMQKIKSKFKTTSNLFCIDYCKEGRIEQEIKPNTYSYIQSGDCKIDNLLTHDTNFYFPLSHYQGITIAFDIEMASKSIVNIYPQFPFDLNEIKERFCLDDNIYFIRNDEHINQIFNDLSNIPEEIKINYLQIKVIELLLYIGSIKISAYNKKPIYFYKTQTEKVKTIHKFITDNYDSHYTLDYLANHFNISLTTMKLCFKEMYGKPINAYLRSFRMNKACELLIFTDNDIAYIAGICGYDNPSKFSSAFKKEIGMLPMQYRKKHN